MIRKILSAVGLGALSLCVLLLWRGWRDRAPELENLAGFDPWEYTVTRSVQNFRLKSNDRNWLVESCTCYDAEGDVQTQELYLLDETGQAYYIRQDGQRQDVGHMPRKGLSDPTRFLTGWNIRQEICNSQGQLLFRDAVFPDNPHHSEQLFYYYRTAEEVLPAAEAMCAFVRVSRFTYEPGQDTFLFDENEEPVYEETCYEIDCYDYFGNEAVIWVDRPCYIKTDAEGYLQMIVETAGHFRCVIRTDSWGRKRWTATYDQDGSVINYSVYTYKELPSPLDQS